MREASTRQPTRQGWLAPLLALRPTTTPSRPARRALRDDRGRGDRRRRFLATLDRRGGGLPDRSDDARPRAARRSRDRRRAPRSLRPPSDPRRSPARRAPQSRFDTSCCALRGVQCCRRAARHRRRDGPLPALCAALSRVRSVPQRARETALPSLCSRSDAGNLRRLRTGRARPRRGWPMSGVSQERRPRLLGVRQQGAPDRRRRSAALLPVPARSRTRRAVRIGKAGPRGIARSNPRCRQRVHHSALAHTNERGTTAHLAPQIGCTDHPRGPRRRERRQQRRAPAWLARRDRRAPRGGPFGRTLRGAVSAPRRASIPPTGGSHEAGCDGRCSLGCGAAKRTASP